MMRFGTAPALVLGPAAVVLAGCHPQAEPAPLPHPPAGKTCNAARAQGLIGTVIDDAAAARAQRRSGARLLRVLLPGQAMTMDYRPDRLNIILGPGRVASRINCG